MLFALFDGRSPVLPPSLYAELAHGSRGTSVPRHCHTRRCQDSLLRFAHGAREVSGSSGRRGGLSDNIGFGYWLNGAYLFRARSRRLPSLRRHAGFVDYGSGPSTLR
jgi:hypothetical protein